MAKKKKAKIIILALGAVLITLGVVLYSEQSFKAAYKGLLIWWEIVLPALLPFFILTEILFGLGVVHFIGTFLEPLMRPLFRIPGVGAFAFAMGLASGYPIGAKITGDLRRKNLCTKKEGERLLALCNTADPLFMIGAVSIGMFKISAISGILCICHYVAAILVGLVFRFYGKNSKEEKIAEQARIPTKSAPVNPLFLFKKSLIKMIAAREADKRTLGEIFGDAVSNSINTILLVGGFIITFSVLTELINHVQLSLLDDILYYVFLFPFRIPRNFLLPIFSGFFEITNGTSLTSSCDGSLFLRTAIANAIIAWSGLSVLAQTATMVKGTDLSLKPYVFARLLHAVLSAGMTFIWWQPLQTLSTVVFKNPFARLPLWGHMMYTSVIFLIILAIASILSILIVSRRSD